jgi:hypothetical protein
MSVSQVSTFVCGLGKFILLGATGAAFDGKCDVVPLVAVQSLSGQGNHLLLRAVAEFYGDGSRRIDVAQGPRDRSRVAPRAPGAGVYTGQEATSR